MSAETRVSEPSFEPVPEAPRLILASASESRRGVLKRAGIPATVEPAAVDEQETKTSLRAAGASASQAAETLAELKAQRVARNRPGALVIGADQMLECEDAWFDKPRDRAEAAAQLRALSGRSHALLTSVCLVRDATRLWHHNAVARLTMRNLDEAFIEAYLDALGEAAYRSVGAYQIEGLGAQLFERIEGDHFAILGLPLLPLLAILREHGVVAR